jgi:hypothetical protein
MKKILLAIFSTVAFAGMAHAQATFQWGAPGSAFIAQTNNTAWSPFLYSGGFNGPGGAQGNVALATSGKFYYELLTSTGLSTPPTSFSQFGYNLANSWVDTGLTETNGTAANGRMVAINGSPDATGTNWASGSTQNMIMVGWSANLGTNWSQALSNLNNWNNYSSTLTGTAYFGVGQSVAQTTAYTVSPGVTVFGSGSSSVMDGSAATGHPLQLYPLLGQPGDPPYFYFTGSPTQTVSEGSSFTWSPLVSGDIPMTFQWYFNSVAIPGATNATYTINPVQVTNTGSYFIVGSNHVKATTGQTETLNVTPTITITAPLTNQTIAAGSPLSLSVSASSLSPLSYQWWYNNSPIPGATGSSASWNPALTNYSGVFQVIITNQAGALASQTATVLVYQAASIITPPSGLLVSYGDPATFYVNAIGFPGLAYQWSFNGTNLAGATNSTFSIGSVNVSNLGNYSVLVTNAYGWSNSPSAALTMLPSLVNPFTGSSGLWGQPDTLSVGAVGSGTLSYQWFMNGVAIPGATSASYYLPSLQLTNGGSYYVVVSSTYGGVTNAAATLNVRPSDLVFGQYAGITVQGSVGNAYLIQYSTDLVTWTTATNVTLTTPTFQWADFGVDMRFNPGRYYRVIPAQ